MVLTLSLYDPKRSWSQDTAFFFYNRTKSMEDVPQGVGVLRVDCVSFNDLAATVTLLFPGRETVEQKWPLHTDHQIAYEGGVITITPLDIDEGVRVSMALTLPDHIDVERKSIFIPSYLHRLPLELDL